MLLWWLLSSDEKYQFKKVFCSLLYPVMNKYTTRTEHERETKKNSFFLSGKTVVMQTKRDEVKWLMGWRRKKKGRQKQKYELLGRRREKKEEELKRGKQESRKRDFPTGDDDDDESGDDGERDLKR